MAWLWVSDSAVWADSENAEAKERVKEKIWWKDVRQRSNLR